MAQFQKITPFLWFDNQAKDAATYYCSLFKDAKIISSSELIVEFELEGMRFTGLNGGPRHTFTEAISFLILCEDQEEVDFFWDHFVNDGGREDRCGWCKDKFGLSWQVIPRRFMEMMKSGEPEKIKKVFEVMMQMRKMIVADFEKAFNP
jgi:predicted 3-demethylubiquinone-9 3-methyltransferase (glyoxalase superfamily)